MSTLVGRIREVTGLKGILQYGRGQEWVVLCRGAREEYAQIHRKLKAEFETWMRTDVTKNYTLVTYFYVIRDTKGNLLGTAHTFKRNETREMNVLVDYNRYNTSDVSLKQAHAWNSRVDKGSTVTYKQISKVKV